MEISRFSGKILPLAAIAATLGLFAAMMVLLSRWISQLSEAELQRAKIRLQMSVRAVQTDVNRELTRAQILFQWESGLPAPDWARRTSEAYSTWRQTAQFPDLIRRVLLAVPDGAAGLRTSVYNPETHNFNPTDWPAELADLRSRLALPFKDYRVFGMRTFTGVALAGAPVLVFAVDGAFRQGLPANYLEASAWLLLELNQPLLLTKIIPESIRDNLEQPDQFDFEVAQDGFSDRIVYQSNPGATFSSADAGCSLLETRREYVRSQKGGNGRTPRFPFGQNPVEYRMLEETLHLWQYVRVALPGVPPAAPAEGGAWQLRVRHRAGSLEAAAARMRRGNLFLGFAMMALVAANLAFLGLSVHRAHRLAEARLQFAAGVSHELRTPLAAICSAADNLAAGIVYEPSKVRQYGAAILDQGRQLAEMVEQILAFSGGQIGKEYYRSEAVDPGVLVRQAIGMVTLAAREAGIIIEEQIPGGLTPVLGDSRALRQALVNLLQNAIRYGGAGRWIGVSVSPGNGGGFEVRIADNGPGIPAGELKRIFEPFYRSATTANSQQRGSGLGLAIVEQTARAHGGHVSVESQPGHGSCFTLHLPAVPQ